MIDLVLPHCFKTSRNHPISILKELQLIITLLIRVFENPSDFGIISKHIVILHFCHTEVRVFAIFMPINLPQIHFSPQPESVTICRYRCRSSSIHEQAEKACATSNDYSCVLKFLISQTTGLSHKSTHQPSASAKFFEDQYKLIRDGLKKIDAMQENPAPLVLLRAI